MKCIKLCMLIAAFCCAVPVSAQKMFASEKYSAMCSYYGEAISGNITAYEADETAEVVVKNIMSVIGLRANFELRAANVPNAAAVILKSKRYILYNPEFMNNINSASGSNWAAISILAHEIGHHLNGHTLDQVGSKPQTELEADEFSGFVLRRMGASLADAQAAMGLIASIKGSHSHPAKKDRLAYIAAGWNKAGGIQDNTAVASVSKQVATPKPTVVKPAPKPAARPATRAERIKESTIASNYIASDAYFNSDPKGKYFITVRGNLVQVEDDNVYLLGSLARSNKPGYRLMLAGDRQNIYIGNNGALVNNYGKRIGHLVARE